MGKRGNNRGMEKVDCIRIYPPKWETGKNPSYVGECVTAAMRATEKIKRIIIDREGLAVVVPVDSDAARLHEKLQAAMPAGTP